MRQQQLSADGKTAPEHDWPELPKNGAANLCNFLGTVRAKCCLPVAVGKNRAACGECMFARVPVLAQMHTSVCLHKNASLYVQLFAQARTFA